jgi:4-amino-4-deoxy-L-arabinose transferase-like glycosyltransferase
MSKTRVQTSIQLLLLVFIVGLGLMIRLQHVGQDLENLVQIVPDDAFYYLTTAENITSGFGSTFDQIHPTNGYHPLWMAIVVGLSAVFDTTHLINSVLLAGIALTLLAAGVCLHLVYKLTDNRWFALVGFGLFYLNPAIYLASINMMETSVVVLFFTLALYIILLTAASNYSQRRTVALGMVLGLLFLARTDQVFFIAAFGGLYLWQAAGGRRLRAAVILGGVSAIVVAPWLIYNLTTFGSILQVSGSAIPYRNNYTFNLLNPVFSEQLDARYQEVYRKLPGYFVIFLHVSYNSSVLVSGFFVILMGLYWRRFRQDEKHRLFSLALLWIPLAILLFAHGSIRLSIRAWYFNHATPLVMLTFLYPAYLFIRYHASTPQTERLRIPVRLAAAAFWLACALMLFKTGQHYYQNTLQAAHRYPQQVEMLAASYWLRDNTEPDAIAASFNAGIFGFFSERRVVNLDGVINNAAYEAIRTHDLLRFIDTTDADYYIDFNTSIGYYDNFVGSWDQLEFELLTELDHPQRHDENKIIEVYRLVSKSLT